MDSSGLARSGLHIRKKRIVPGTKKRGKGTWKKEKRDKRERPRRHLRRLVGVLRQRAAFCAFSGRRKKKTVKARRRRPRPCWASSGKIWKTRSSPRLKGAGWQRKRGKKKRDWNLAARLPFAAGVRRLKRASLRRALSGESQRKKEGGMPASLQMKMGIRSEVRNSAQALRIYKEAVIKSALLGNRGRVRLEWKEASHKPT